MSKETCFIWYSLMFHHKSPAIADNFSWSKGLSAGFGVLTTLTATVGG